METQEATARISNISRMNAFYGIPNVSPETALAIERGMPAPEVYSSEDRQEAAPTAENGQQNATATSPVEAYFSQVTESLQISDQASALQQQTQAQERATDSGSGGNQPAEQMPGGQVAATYSASSADAPGNATATTSPASDVQAAAGTGVGPTYTSRAGGATAPMGGSATAPMGGSAAESLAAPRPGNATDGAAQPRAATALNAPEDPAEQMATADDQAETTAGNGITRNQSGYGQMPGMGNSLAGAAAGSGAGTGTLFSAFG